MKAKPEACWRWLYELSANTVDVGAPIPGVRLASSVEGAGKARIFANCNSYPSRVGKTAEVDEDPSIRPMGRSI